MSVKKNETLKNGIRSKSGYIYAAAFIVPAAIMFAAFALLKIYPFGDRQVLVVDAWNQYYPFLVELSRKLKGGESLLYCWRLGMGGDFVSLMAYYLASPLNLLAILVPESMLREAFALLILVKLGFAGAFCAFSLRRMSGEGKWETLNAEKDFGVIIFSTFYALCGWTIGYYWNIMWLDTFALFPLVALGIYLLVNEKKYKLYTISLAVAIYANYYIGLMVCIFTAFFFFIQCVAHKNSWKDLWSSLKRIVLFSVLSIMMSAVATLPTVVSLQNAYKSGNGPGRGLTAGGWLEAFSNLFAYLEPTRTGGRPYIYSGVLCVVLLAVFCRLPKVSKREKAAYLLAVLFVFASANINLLNYVWHGFHAANSLPYRFVFFLSFLLAFLAYKAYINIEALKKRDCIIVGSVCGLCYLFMAGDAIYRYGRDNGDLSFAEALGTQGAEFWPFLLGNLSVLAAYLTILTLMVNKKVNKGVCGLLLALVAGLELIPTVLSGTKAIGTTDRAGFPDRYVQVKEALADIEARGDGDEFYRTELASRQGWNSAALYGYNGMSFFSSTANVAVTQFFENMGMGAWQAANRYHYQNTTPVNNAFLNLKYMISRGSEAANGEYLAETERVDDVYIYENKAYLPIGFMVEGGLTDFRFEGNTPFEIQNNFLKAAAGTDEDVFEALDVIHVGHQNVYVTRSDYGVYQYRPLETEGASGSEKEKFKYNFEMPKDGAAYAFVDLRPENTAENTVKVEFEGESWSYTVYQNGGFFPAGTYKKGDLFSVRSEMDAGRTGKMRIFVSILNQEEFDRAYALLADEALNVTEQTSRSLKGSITVKKDNLLYTSIPYEKGWKAYVDGRRTDVILIADVFMGVALTKGEHTVEFVYSPGHVYFAIGISVTGIAAFGLVCALERKCRKVLWFFS